MPGRHALTPRKEKREEEEKERDRGTEGETPQPHPGLLMLSEGMKNRTENRRKGQEAKLQPSYNGSFGRFLQRAGIIR